MLQEHLSGNRDHEGGIVGALVDIRIGIDNLLDASD